MKRGLLLGGSLAVHLEFDARNVSSFVFCLECHIGVEEHAEGRHTICTGALIHEHMSSFRLDMIKAPCPPNVRLGLSPGSKRNTFSEWLVGCCEVSAGIPAMHVAGS